MHKFVDIKEDFVNYHRWDGELPFRGVETCKSKSGGEYQPFKWCPLDSCVGEMIMYTTGH